jgi:hypothetical protein
MPSNTTVEVESIYGATTGRGLVRLRVADRTVHMPVGKAREVGAWMLDAATAAESDAAFMALLAETTMGPEEQGQMLGRLRKHREEVQKAEADLNGPGVQAELIEDE